MKLRYTPRAKLDLAITSHKKIRKQQGASSCSSAKRPKRYRKILKSAGWVESPEPAINRWPLPVHACLSHRIGRDTGFGGSAYSQIVAGKFLILIRRIRIPYFSDWKSSILGARGFE